MVFVASCPMMSSATDEAGESVVTKADCDEFVHRIFNMVSEIFSLFHIAYTNVDRKTLSNYLSMYNI